MFTKTLSLFLLFSIISIDFIKSDDYFDDYIDDAEHSDYENCEYEIDFKVFKKTPKLDLCDQLKNPSAQSHILLQIYANHSSEKLQLRASSSESKLNQSLISLTTDILEDLKYPISLLEIDNYQLLSLTTLQTILSSLINTNLNLLSKNLKKTLIAPKGGHKQMLSCSGSVYPKQNIQNLNIKPSFTNAITCNKEIQTDRFFTLQEQLFLNPLEQKTFNLINIHQDDSKKISRTTWYTCNHLKACKIGLQDKTFLDKTVNYVVKYLQNDQTVKKPASG